MAERNFPYVVVWVLFLAAMFTGAGLLLSPDPGRRGWGLALLLAPAVVFALLMALYYWRSRRMARQEAGAGAPGDADRDVDTRGVPGREGGTGMQGADQET